MFCKQCKQNKPNDAFRKMPKRYKVKICMACAEVNMARWAVSGAVGKEPDDIKTVTA